MEVYVAINKSELDSGRGGAKQLGRGERLFKTHLEAMNSIIKDSFSHVPASHIHLDGFPCCLFVFKRLEAASTSIYAMRSSSLQ